VADDDHAPERAAIWYVGAFGALGAVLLAGVSIAGVDWTHAQHPVEALLVVGVAVVAAFAVVTLASRVIYPGYTSVVLRERTGKVQRRLQRRKKDAGASLAVTWEEIAGEDKGVLRALFAEDAFSSSPDTLWAGAQDKGKPDEATRSQAELKAMVDAANNWKARKHFKALRYVAPLAALVVLIGGIAWKPLTAPRQTIVSSAQPSPIPAEQLLVLKEQQALVHEQLGLLSEKSKLLSKLNQLLLSEQHRHHRERLRH
jgi:hypothetical protein